MSEAQWAVLAWMVVCLVALWGYLWKCIAFWTAARRDQMGWYVVLAVVPPVFGVLEMIYVFLVAPRQAELGERPGRARRWGD